MEQARPLARPRTLTRAGAAGAALLALTACSGIQDGRGDQAGASEPAPASGPVLVDGAEQTTAADPAGPAGPAVGGEPLEGLGHLLRSRVTRVAGPLTDVRRDRVARRARAVVAGYLESAFLRTGDPFRAFTGEARRAARSDGELLTGSRGVELRRAHAWFSVAAPGGRPVGLTARVLVELADGRRAESVTGRLLLTRTADGWRVFGYDLARSDRGGEQ